MFTLACDLWPDPMGHNDVPSLGLWLLLSTNCRRHGTAPCRCDFTIGTSADELIERAHADEESEYARLETEDPDIAAVLPW